MKTQKDLRFLTRLALAAFLFSGAIAVAQTSPRSPSGTQKEYEHLIYSVKGPDLYRAHCAACHGSSGKGNGPMAQALKEKPGDLTVLARNNGNTFPANRVAKFITGEQVVAAHGSREMPVWGPIFHQIEEDQDFGNLRIRNLIRYLESIQQK